MQFLDVKTDFAFKKVFGSEQSKSILKSFLNGVIDFEGDCVIDDLVIVDPYQIPLLKGMKDTYVDVKAVLSDGRRVIIEMQVLNIEGFEKRVLYNAAKAYSTQLMKAEQFHTLEPIIALTITDFTMFDDIDKVISYFKLMEKDSLISYSDDVELIFIELPKFTKTESEIETIADKWIYFIKNAGSLEYIPETLQSETEIREAFKTANMSGLSAEEHEMQFKRKEFIWMNRGAIDKALTDGRREGMAEGMAEGMEKGMEKGMEESCREIAKNMLDMGVDVQTISKVTGLSEETIKKKL